MDLSYPLLVNSQVLGMCFFPGIRRYLVKFLQENFRHTSAAAKPPCQPTSIQKDFDNQSVIRRNKAEETVHLIAGNIANQFGDDTNTPDGSECLTEKQQLKAVQAIAQIENLCAQYAHGIYVPDFPQIIERLSTELSELAWIDGGEEAFDKAVRFQSCFNALPNERRYEFSSEEMSDISILAKKNEGVILSEKQKRWEEFSIRTFVADDVQDLIVFVKHRKLDWGRFYLDLIAYFPESCRSVFLNNVRSSVLYHAFNQSFFDGPASIPFERKIEGHNRIRGRDGTGTKLTAKLVDPKQVEEFKKADCVLPAAYIHLAIEVRMM